MKSKKNQRLLALILSMVLMLSASISAMAEGDAQTEASGTETTESQEAAQGLESTSAASYSEAVPEATVSEEEIGTESQPAETSVQENTEEQQPTEDAAESPEMLTESAEPIQEVAESTAETPQGQVENTELQEETAPAEEIPAAEQAEEIVSQAAELKQEFTDENGNVIQTVAAYVPEGAFQATADQISMEVSLLNADDTNYIKGMAEKLIPENYYLEGYVFYQIDFKVNGEITKPAKAITITMNGNDLAVEDTQKAHVFYYVPEDPEVEGDEDQLTEVIQKDQLVKSLEESGQSTDNIEEYDYSEITVNQGNADTITVKGWESTIYGCYVEKEAVTELTYEDGSVTITVSADQAGIIPNGAELSVTPIQKTQITDDMSEDEKAQAEEINAQYDFTEEQLQKDSEENDTTMEGFLAYDICFLVDGEEVEPSGDVRVVMDFKEAAIPEGVSEDAEVAVKHLKEDESAEDGVIVENVIAKTGIKTTDKAEVEKVEFTSDSFSTFSLTWNDLGRLTVQVVNADGIGIGTTNNNTYSFSVSDHRTDVNTIANKIQETNKISDKFNRAVYVKENADFSFTAQRVYGIYCDTKNQYKYCDQSNITTGNGWNNIGNGTVYFIFGDDPKLTETKENTVSTKDTIKINLFDYQVGQDGNESADWKNQSGINGVDGHSVLKFVDDKGNGYKNININQNGLEGYINSGMVSSKLSESGFPILSTEKGGDGTSLDYLFDTNTIDGVKSVYTNLDNLFKINNDGYHVFNSDENYAYLPYSDLTNSFSSDFNVVNINGQDSVGFYPFTQPTFDSLANHKISSQKAKLGYTGVNHYFGMTIETTFLQPKDGKITDNYGNSKDMIFEFSGDDDVWVFIDDVLVLDLGGIHGKVSGTINFSNGTITRTDVDNSNVGTVSLEQAFKNAGVNGNFSETGGFADYSSHNIKFFYLERGNVESNCKIVFNFPTIDDESIYVGKQITDVDTSKYKDIEFEFFIEVGDEKSSLSKYYNQSFDIYDLETMTDTGKNGTTDSNGYFTLKHNEVAVFENIGVNKYYRVTEKNLNSQEFNGVWINETEMVSSKYNETVSSDGTITGNKDNEPYEVISPEYRVDETRGVIFYNRCSEYNKRELHIEKQMKQGQTSDAEFQIEVKLDNTNYSGNYIKLDVNDNPSSPMTTTNGIITLKVGEEAVISDIPAGTSFEIIENTDSLLSEYISPEYRIENGGEAASNENKAVGNIVPGLDTKVVVINGFKSIEDTTFIKVQKKFIGLDSPETELPNFKISIYSNKNEESLIKELTLSSSSYTDRINNEDGSITFIWEIYNLEGGTYWIKEENAVLDSFKVDTTVNDKVVDLTTNKVISVDIVAPTFEFDQYKEIPECSATTIPFQANVVAARLTDNTYFVWSEQPLSAQERRAIISAISTKNNNWNSFTVENTLFYSGLGNGDDGYVTGAGTIYIKRENQNTLLNFSAKNVWRQCISGIYERTAGQNAEIEIVNGYTEKSVAIDLQKFGTSYGASQLSGAKFSLYKGSLDNGASTISWHQNPEDDYNNFMVNPAGNPELNITPGYYKLVETTAPDNCILLTSPILFKVEDGTVSLVDESGTSLSTNPDMWQLVINESGSVKFVIQIKNEIIYALPSAGGPGIFLYMIGGTLLLMVGSLMIYINRRKGGAEKIRQ